MVMMMMGDCLLMMTMMTFCHERRADEPMSARMSDRGTLSSSAGSRGLALQEYHMSFLQRRSVHKDSGALQQPLSLHCAQQSSFG